MCPRANNNITPEQLGKQIQRVVEAGGVSDGNGSSFYCTESLESVH